VSPDRASTRATLACSEAPSKGSFRTSRATVLAAEVILRRLQGGPDRVRYLRRALSICSVRRSLSPCGREFWHPIFCRNTLPPMQNRRELHSLQGFREPIATVDSSQLHHLRESGFEASEMEPHQRHVSMRRIFAQFLDFGELPSRRWPPLTIHNESHPLVPAEWLVAPSPEPVAVDRSIGTAPLDREWARRHRGRESATVRSPLSSA